MLYCALQFYEGCGHVRLRHVTPGESDLQKSAEVSPTSLHSISLGFPLLHFSHAWGYVISSFYQGAWAGIHHDEL